MNGYPSIQKSLSITRHPCIPDVAVFFRNPEVIDECELDEQTKRVLLSNIKRRLTPQAVKIRSGLLQVVHGHSTLHTKPPHRRSRLDQVCCKLFMVTQPYILSPPTGGQD